MIHESPEAASKSLRALEEAFKGALARTLTEQESERNLADNLVTVAAFDSVETQNPDGSLNMKSRSDGTGLRVTTDGFVITAFHNIAPHENDWKRMRQENPPTQANVRLWTQNMKQRYAVVDRYRNAFPIDIAFWARNEELDIALIKAVMLGDPKPVEFMIATEDLKVGDPVTLFGLRNQREYNQLGQVTCPTYDVKIHDRITGQALFTIRDTFLTDAYGTPGFSGGVFTTSGKLAGLASYIERNGNSDRGYAGGAKVRNIVNLVEAVVRGD